MMCTALTQVPRRELASQTDTSKLTLDTLEDIACFFIFKKLILNDSSSQWSLLPTSHS